MPSSEALSLLIKDLELSGFEGDIESSYAERIVAATDNSIYQLMPLGIIYPRVEEDINRVMRVIYKHRQAGFSICARGGGTGTNGQSLSDNLILDCSRFMNKIIEFDEQKRTVTVQPGVVLDQLNHFLKPYGLIFPIDISSSSRATLGGMVATDASGKGSLIYQKTSSHIQSMDLVLADGSNLRAESLSQEELVQDHPYHRIYQLIDQQRDEITRIFPEMNRGLTGYNLQQCSLQKGVFNPCYLFSGSEGTLALTRQITLRLLLKPTHKMLTVILYDHFISGLEHVQHLLASRPAAIEMLDDKILQLARTDSIWFDVKKVLDGLADNADIKATNFVEHVGYSEQELKQYRNEIEQILAKTSSSFRVILTKVETKTETINALWNLRKKAVGLLGQSQNGKRGVAFVEDTAVPPQNLAAYVTDFKTLLDDYKLDYGMYGHADAGVLHVRPTLNLLQQNDRHLIRIISDKVASLAIKHGGILWGEHGRGFRGEYTPLFFGENLYPLLCNIKKIFDPSNILNPGKLTAPEHNQALLKLDKISMRGELDAQIDSSSQLAYASSISCNGNGSCYNWDPLEAMCPSFKATGNKLYSPKGRAAMLREWLRLKNGNSTPSILNSLEQSLFKSLQHCLSCKSCTNSCPLKVDIPELKSRFLEHWYRTKQRPISSLFIRYFETLISLGRLSPVISNAVIQYNPTKKLIQKISHLKHLPTFSSKKLCSAIVLNSQNLHNIEADKKAIILLRDNYMQSFDRQTLQSCCDVFQKLGYQVYLSETIHNGKILHVKGYREAFKKQAQKVIAVVNQYAQTGLPLISTETVSRLMFSMEYAEILEQKNSFEIQSIESFIAKILQQTRNLPVINIPQPIKLLPHCMEQTSAKESSQHWQTIFEKLGVSLTIINAGCCGMSGIFGHEIENSQLSEDIFNLAWKPALQSTSEIILASGFSCRCQSLNHQFKTIHPITLLSQYL